MVMNSPDETLGESFNLRCVCRLHIGRGTAKFARMLAKAPSRQRAVRVSVTNKGAPGILLAAISRNDFLDKNFFRPDLASCTFVVLVKLFDGIAAPGLCACGVEEIFLNGRLDCQRQPWVERWELIRVLWIKCLRTRDAQCLSQVISLLLVPSPLDALPFSRGNLKESGESSARWRENAATVSSLVGIRTHPRRLKRLPTSSTLLTVLRSSRMSDTRITRDAYREKREMQG